ncbi:HDR062Cp [Eremothecium sinecaudum]|uniref:HDR062Cp n=1 Tax=Eremothecium sinecaudum TaxID=45286 RepID=A0A0X8HSS2_9SACH|nr:HDR062Cp [Eremothecium sinecaudum]AMD20804.1 HDR062Cp [Eremothecium sinecaudum]
MPHERFIIPTNFSLPQSLSLLYSTADAQFNNVFKNAAEQISASTTEDYYLGTIISTLDNILHYLADGVETLSSYYAIAPIYENPPLGNVLLVRRLIRLKADIAKAKDEAINALQISRSGLPDNGDNIFLNAFNTYKAELIENAGEPQGQQNYQTSLGEKHLESGAKNPFKFNTYNNNVTENMRKAEVIESQRNEVQNVAPDGSNARKDQEQSYNGRTNKDIHRRTESITKNSHDYDSSRDSNMEQIGLEVNKAALLAWFKDKNHDNQPESSKVERKPTQVRPPRAKHEYVKPEIRRITPRLSSYKQMKRSTSQNSKGTNSTSQAGPSEERNEASNSKSNKGPVSETKNVPQIETSAIESSVIDERIDSVLKSLKGVDVNACEQIIQDILVVNDEVLWNDIAGLNNAKNCLKETVVYPLLRPDLFRGLREPTNGILLFGPPGTGKTMIAKAVATESKATFFSISASSLLSKYLGESEKLVKALFYLAKRLAPSIIFVDEIDSLLSSRYDNEHESSRRIKTEFLVQWSSLTSATAKESAWGEESRTVLVLAATNLPWTIDEAAIRRFSRRLYIPLPEFETRLQHLKSLMELQANDLTDEDFEMIANLTEGYSGSDITSLAKEAAMEPIRDVGDSLINVHFSTIRGVTVNDFKTAMITIKKSVSPSSLQRFDEWAVNFGSVGS